MSDNQNPTVRAVQEAVINLTELVEQVAEEANTLREEAQETVFALIAAILVSDGKYEAREQAFLNALVNANVMPRGDLQFLREYADRWRTMGTQVPCFLQTALRHDAKHKTGTARAMMREIQLAANNASISDGRFAAAEHKVVRNYLVFLDEYLET